MLTRSLHALLGLDADAARAGAVPAFAHGGVLPALVVQNHDAREGRHRMGQVRVAFPCLQDVHPAIAEKDSPLLPWARCLAMGASDGPAGPGRKGPGSGFYAIPQPGDEVLCAFLHGDLHHPVIVGRLWNGKQPLPAPTTALEKDPAVASRRKRDGDPPDLAPLAPACLSSGTKRNDVSLWRSRTGNLVCALDEADARRSLLRIIDRTGATMIELREGRIDIVETPKDVRVLAEAAVRIDCERLEVAARGSARIEVGREGDERGVSNLALISDRGDIAAEVGGRFALGARAAKLRDDLPALGVSLRAGRSLSALAGGSASVVAAQGLMRLEAQAGSVSITAAAGDLSAIAREGISISVAGEAQVRAPELKIHSDGAVNIRTLTRLEWKGAEVFVNANPPTLPQDAWLADTFSLVEDMKEGDPTAVLLESPQAKEALAGVVDLIDAQLGPLDPETRKALEALIQDLAPDLVQALLSGEMSPAEVAKIALDAAMKQGINLLARKAVDFLAKEFQERTGIALSNDDVEFIADLLADLVSGAGTEGCVREAFAYVAQKLLEMARSEIERLAGVRIRTKAWKSFAGKIAEEIKGGTKGNVSGTMDALADLFPALVDLVLDVVLGYVEEELEARVNITLPDGKLPELAAKVTGIVRSVFGEDGRTSKSALTGGLQGVLGQVIDALKDPLCAWLVLEVKRLTKLSLDAAAVAGVFDRVVKPLVAGSFDLVGSLRTIGESLLRCLKDPLIAWARDGVITLRRMNRTRVRGFVVERGTVIDPTYWFYQEENRAAVIGAAGALEAARGARFAIVDGVRGVAYFDPRHEVLVKFSCVKGLGPPPRDLARRDILLRLSTLLSSVRWKAGEKPPFDFPEEARLLALVDRIRGGERIEDGDADIAWLRSVLAGGAPSSGEEAQAAAKAWLASQDPASPLAGLLEGRRSAPAPAALPPSPPPAPVPAPARTSTPPIPSPP